MSGTTVGRGRDRLVLVDMGELRTRAEGYALSGRDISLLGRLEQGVRRLQAAGCADIHIVTDHGFLLREKVSEPEKVKAKKEDGILKKQERYLIGRNLPSGFHHSSARAVNRATSVGSTVLDRVQGRSTWSFTSMRICPFFPLRDRPSLPGGRGG